MLADDFLFGVALEAFGSGIPGLNHATGIDHVDRIIGYGLNKPVKALLIRSLGLLHVFCWHCPASRPPIGGGSTRLNAKLGRRFPAQPF